MSVFSELKRRNVYKVATVYIVGSWLLLQIASVLFPAFDMPNSAMRILAVGLLFAFPVALTLTWAFELTPEGIQKSSDTGTPSPGRKLNLKFTAFLLVLGVVIIAILLAIPKTRSWLIETGVNLAMETAAAISPFELDKQLGIAVLPFADMSKGGDNEYFSDGISEEILNVLVKTSRMPVIARTSSFQFKGQNQDIKKIGATLGVTHILEGSVRKSGNKVRITAQLIDTATGAHLWSDSYDRTLADIFIVQDEIAGMIVQQIGNTLEPEERERLYVEVPGGELQSRGTTSAEAHEALLRGIQLLNTDNPFKKEESLAYFDRAIALDGGYVDAWALKGHALNDLGSPQVGLRIPAEVYPQAMVAFQKALELDPNNAFSMGWLGLLLIAQEFKWNEGLQLMERSLELSPNDAQLLSTYGMYLTYLRREGAQEVMDKAYRLNPLDPLVIMIRAGSLAAEGKYLDGAALMETARINNPQGYVVNRLAAWFAVALGRVEKAREYIEKAQQVVGTNYPGLRILELRLERENVSGDSVLVQALEDEILTLAETNYIAYLSNFSWFSEKSTSKAWDIAVRQRHTELVFKLFQSKPALLSEAQWQQIRETTHVAEVTLGSATNLLDRSNEEQEQLRANTIELSIEELDRFVGAYSLTSSDRQVSIKRVNNRLVWNDRLDMFAVGPTSFAFLRFKATSEFSVTDGRVTGFTTEEGDVRQTWIRTGDSEL